MNMTTKTTNIVARSASRLDHVSPGDLDVMARAYLECALLSSMDESDDQGGEPMDHNYDLSDLSDDFLHQAALDCLTFRSAHASDLQGLDLVQVGQDLWLSRNGHGAGFFDHYPSEPRWDRLQEAARRLGEVFLYVDDDGMINAM